MDRLFFITQEESERDLFCYLVLQQNGSKNDLDQLPHSNPFSLYYFRPMKVFAISIAAYAGILHFLYSRFAHDSSLCGEYYTYPPWAMQVVTAALGAFVFSCLIQLRRLASGQSQGHMKIILETLGVNAIIGGFSLAAQLFRPNTCVDAFGYNMPL